MGTKMEIGGEAMHLRSRDLWYEGHAALCTKRRPPKSLIVVLGRSAAAYTRPDGVHVVPISALRP